LALPERERALAQTGDAPKNSAANLRQVAAARHKRGGREKKTNTPELLMGAGKKTKKEKSYRGAKKSRGENACKPGRLPSGRRRSGADGRGEGAVKTEGRCPRNGGREKT